MYIDRSRYPMFQKNNFCVMPPGLPDRFYPEDKTLIYKTEQYVICFKKSVSLEEKNQIVKDYAEFYEATKPIA